MKQVTQSQASKRLFKKIAALRATLPNDEREVLDGLIPDEVTAHKMNLAKATAKNSAKAGAKATEVNAHKMNLAKATAKNSAKAGAKATEVNAHQLKIG